MTDVGHHEPATRQTEQLAGPGGKVGEGAL
jgi:hypothetical protein